MLFSENEWKSLSSSKSRGSQTLVDILLREPAIDERFLPPVLAHGIEGAAGDGAHAHDLSV